jgi:hypothetical protein
MVRVEIAKRRYVAIRLNFLAPTIFACEDALYFRKRKSATQLKTLPRQRRNKSY